MQITLNNCQCIHTYGGTYEDNTNKGNTDEYFTNEFNPEQLTVH